MADIVYQADLDDSRVLKALQRIDKNIDRIARDADKQFQGIGKSAGASGVQIGAVAGVVASLTTAFIQLGQQAITALIDIGKQSVETALEVDTLKARLRGIFDGSQEAADQAFTFIQQKSKELGFDLSELAGAFIPKTESLAQFERVAKIATALARSDPEQGAIGARIALIEALSGTFTSLQRRFELGKTDTERIKEAFDKEGIEGFLTTLETVLQEGGRSFDDFADTAATSFAKVQISSEQILGRVGAPIVASLEQAANKLLEFLSANEDELIVFADTIGRAIADVIDFLASVDLGELDTDSLIEFADYIFRIVNAVELVVSQFTGWVASVYQAADAIGPLGESLDALWYLLTNIDDALVTLSQILAISKAGYEGLYAGIEPLLPLLENLFAALGKAAAGDFLGAAVAIGDSIEALKTATFDSAAAQDAINASLAESAQAFADYQSDVDGNTDSQKKLREELEETKNAGTGAADAIQAAAAAERQASEDADKLAGAQAKVNEAMAEAEKDFKRKLEDIDIAAERKRLDIAIEFAQKREDAARDNLQKLADIQKKNQQDITDAATDLSRKEEDIARKFAEDRIDLEREQRQKRVDVEREYRLKIQDIQRQFLLDADEAEQKRDAVAFLRAVKERDKQVQEAQITRQRDIEELKINGEQRKEELRTQQARELEEARLANERKLEDLRLNLERQIEAQNTAYAQQLEDLAIGEQRKNDEAAMARERDIEDAKKAYARKLEDLKTALAEELAIIEEFAAKKAAAEAAAKSSGTSKASSPTSSKPGKPSKAGGKGAGFGSNPGTITGHAFGGLVNRGQAVPVGERGPELFTPNANGRIVPNNALLMPSMTPKSMVSNITNNNQKSASLGGLLDANSLDALLAAKVQNMLIHLLDRVS
jgi:hypothetical protein